MDNMNNKASQPVLKQVIAENIKLTVTINGDVCELDMPNVPLGTRRQIFVNAVTALGEQLALSLQDQGILPYTDFAVIDDESGLRAIGVRPKRD